VGRGATAAASLPWPQVPCVGWVGGWRPHARSGRALRDVCRSVRARPLHVGIARLHCMPCWGGSEVTAAAAVFVSLAPSSLNATRTQALSPPLPWALVARPSSAALCPSKPVSFDASTSQARPRVCGCRPRATRTSVCCHLAAAPHARGASGATLHAGACAQYGRQRDVRTVCSYASAVLKCTATDLVATYAHLIINAPPNTHTRTRGDACAALPVPHTQPATGFAVRAGSGQPCYACASARMQ
jgi:hypothetical protein